MDLQKEIKKRGLKQNWIAKQVGITPGYLTLILKKQRNLKRNPKLKQSIINAVTGRLS